MQPRLVELPSTAGGVVLRSHRPETVSPGPAAASLRICEEASAAEVRASRSSTRHSWAVARRCVPPSRPSRPAGVTVQRPNRRGTMRSWRCRRQQTRRRRARPSPPPHQEVLWRGALGLRAPRLLRRRLEHLKVFVEVLVQLEDGRDVAAAVAVVGRAPHRDQLVVEHPLVAVHHQLVGAGDEGHLWRWGLGGGGRGVGGRDPWRAEGWCAWLAGARVDRAGQLLPLLLAAAAAAVRAHDHAGGPSTPAGLLPPASALSWPAARPHSPFHTHARAPCWPG